MPHTIQDARIRARAIPTMTQRPLWMQTQECNLAFAVTKGVSPKNRAILANQTAVFFSKALAALEGTKTAVPWKDHMTLRHKLYTFLALSHNADCLLKTEGVPQFGDAVSCLRLALLVRVCACICVSA